MLKRFFLILDSRSPQNPNWQSVADRINELERQNSVRNGNGSNQSQKYTFLDPSKTTRVPNIALKAFQKDAVQSYFERQQQNTPPREMIRSNSTPNGIISNQTSPQRPQSLPVSKTNSSMAKIALPARSSLPNKLSQIIYLTTQLSAESKKNQSISHLVQAMPIYQVPPPPVSIHASRIMTIEQSNLQGVNESGIPPPLPRRSKPLVSLRR